MAGKHTITLTLSGIEHEQLAALAESEGEDPGETLRRLIARSYQHQVQEETLMADTVQLSKEEMQARVAAATGGSEDKVDE